MNLLIINLDKGIFSENSSSLARLKEYSQLVEKIFVIVWTRKRHQPLVYDNKLFVFPTNSVNRLFYFFDTRRIARQLTRENKIDVIFTQDPFETGLAGWIVSKIKKIPLQLQVHTDFLSPYFWKESVINKARVLLAKFLIPRASSLRVVSERVKNSIVSAFRFPVSKIFVLPIFVNVQKIKNSAISIDLHKKYPQFNFIILMASRFTREKNIGLAIEALRETVKKFPDAGLIIVGGGKEKNKLEEQAVKYKLAGNIKFEPWTDEIFSYYKTADLFLLTSNYEGYGLTVAEAIAAGCPVIMTDVGCARELVRDGKNGMIFPVGNREGLAAKIEQLLADRHLRQSLSAEAVNDIMRLPDKDKYLRIYKESWENTR